jgi:hypothetical protein
LLNNKIIKVGCSITTFIKRVASYNCGKEKYRGVRGTCSTTNYFVLQSLLKLNMPVEVFAYFPETISQNHFGKKIETSFPPKPIEKVILEYFKNEHKRLPTFCSQT